MSKWDPNKELVALHIMKRDGLISDEQYHHDMIAALRGVQKRNGEVPVKFPEHKGGLTLKHNDYKGYYSTAVGYINEYADSYEWENEEAKQRALCTDEIWTLQWYPDTPIGCFALAAPTLEELMAYANKKEGT